MVNKIYAIDKNDPEVVIDNIEIGFDEEDLSYYAVTKLIALGLGKTQEDALEDLRKAGHFGIDTIINTRLNPAKRQTKTITSLRKLNMTAVM